MSSLVGKVKNAVRKRGSKSAMGAESGDSRSSAEYGSRASYEAPGRSSLQNARNSRNMDSQQPGVKETTDQLAGMTLRDHEGQGITGGKTLPPLPANGQPGEDDEGRPQSSQGIPPRKSSLLRKPVATAGDGSGNLIGQKTSRNADLARNENTAGPTTSSKQVKLPPDVRLPAGFHLRNAVETEVDTQYAPAVTHETIRHHTTEIIHQPVQREIHIDHHYTYVQPVKVVEVLPAKHFTLDEATGKRVEIAAPEGWVMPHDAQPSGPQDVSGLKATTRHYLVDEENPNGKLEDAPKAMTAAAAATTTTTTTTTTTGTTKSPRKKFF